MVRWRLRFGRTFEDRECQDPPGEVVPWRVLSPRFVSKAGAGLSTNVMVRGLGHCAGEFCFAQVGGDCRRFVSLRRSATGSGRDIGVLRTMEMERR